MEKDQFQDLESSRFFESQPIGEGNREVEPPIYHRQPVPNPNPLGNLPLVAGLVAMVIVVVCVFASINETQKPEAEKNGWMKSMVEYSVEKRKREQR